MCRDGQHHATIGADSNNCGYFSPLRNGENLSFTLLFVGLPADQKLNGWWVWVNQI
jgi:hypothetical protein